MAPTEKKSLCLFKFEYWVSMQRFHKDNTQTHITESSVVFLTLCFAMKANLRSNIKHIQFSVLNKLFLLLIITLGN